MPRGVLVRLLVVMLAVAAVGTSRFFGPAALASRCDAGRKRDLPPSRLRLASVVPLAAFGATTPTAVHPAPDSHDSDVLGEPADPARVVSSPQTTPDAGPVLAGGSTSQTGPTGLGLWRRTRQGWEKATWLGPAAPHEPALHPLVVTALEILLALTGCVATAGRCRRENGTTAPPPGP